MSVLLADRLKDMWESVEQGTLSYEAFSLEQDQLLEEYRSRWAQALLLENHTNLEDSVLTELSLYTGCSDLQELRRRCKAGAQAVAHDWQRLEPNDEKGIQQFYDQSTSYIYNLMWWHTLADDNSPLAYVTALQFAESNRCRHHLDFGGGVGSGNILFLRNGLNSTLGDISSSLIEFTQWRFRVRKLPNLQYLDLKVESVPDESFDIITAMDVFEHLVDPGQAVEDLWRALKPGGFVFGRFAPDDDDQDHPQHIVHDFAPTMERIQALGFVHVWRDEWLWGHEVFQKPRGA